MNRVLKLALVSSGLYSLYALTMWYSIGALSSGTRAKWISFAIVAVLGAIVAAVIVWYLARRVPSPPMDDELDRLFAAARDCLAGAPATRGKTVGTLPAVILLGPSGSAKTTAVTRSSLDSALLAGHVRRGDEAAPPPTAIANVWYTDRALILEAGGALLADKERWPRFVRRLLPARGLGALFKGKQAPRVAVVCLSSEDLVQAHAKDALAATVLPLQAALSHLASELGVRLPVYVLFTKADKIAGFMGTVSGLTRDEVRDVLGTTLPMELSEPAGSYAERQSQRLTQHFTRLYTSLALDRLRVLARAVDSEQRALAYEFARELRKLAPAATQFLVDLCRPNPLRPSPFLRGFYFVGVRPIVDEGAGEPMAAPSALAPAGATMVLAGPVAAAVRAPAMFSGSGARRKPQWVFLDRVFSDVILADRAALGLTTEGARVDVLRRSVFAVAAVAALVPAIGSTVSFASNRALRNRVANAMSAVAPLALLPGEQPSLATLSRLDTLRETLVLLDSYEEAGPPLFLRWGLYNGWRLLAPARRAYFDAFDRVLFSQTRAGMRMLRPEEPERTVREPGSTVVVTPVRRRTAALRSDFSSAAVSVPLTAAWHTGRVVGRPESDLASAQFIYYAATLSRLKPYALKSDPRIVEVARSFLNQFASSQRIYKVMVDEASRSSSAVSFNRDYPGSADYVRDAYIVPGAYTNNGWTKMQRELASITKYTTAAQWVTGERRLSRPEQDSLAVEVKQRYVADYIAHWREYLRAATVLTGGSLPDQGRRIQALAAAGSPLLRLLAVASKHTAVDTVLIGPKFQPAQAVVPANAGDKLFQPSNQPYMQALLKLGASLTNATDTKGVEDARSALTEVLVAAGQLGQSFAGDAGVASAVKALLDRPTAGVSSLVESKGRVAGSVVDFCKTFEDFASRYPVGSDTNELSIVEFSSVFGSGGAVAKLQNQLTGSVVRQGRDFVRAPDASLHVSDRFLKFFSQLVKVRETLYGSGRADPALTVNLRGEATRDVPLVTLSVDDQTYRWSVSDAGSRAVTWRGASAKHSGLHSDAGSASQSGVDIVWPPRRPGRAAAASPWALLQLFQRHDHYERGATADTYSWDVGGGSVAVLHVDSGREFVSRELFAGLQQCPPLSDR